MQKAHPNVIQESFFQKVDYSVNQEIHGKQECDPFIHAQGYHGNNDVETKQS